MVRAAVEPALYQFALHPKKVRFYQNLVFMPITMESENPCPPVECTPLPMAVQDGTVTVIEMGPVDTLRVTNASTKLVLAIPGTYLNGGRQDRAVRSSVLIPAQASGELLVRCVEQHRWRYKEQEAEEFGTKQDASLTCSTIFSGASTVDQYDVWKAVEVLSSSTSTKSLTMSHGATIEQLRGDTTKYTEAMTAVPLPVGTIGGLFMGYLAGNKVHCALDVFGSCELYEFYFPKLCQSVALAALAGRPSNGSCDYKPYSPLNVVWKAVAHNWGVAKLVEERLPLNAGRLFVKQGGRSGCRVSRLQHQGHTVHEMVRWDAQCV